MEIVFATIVHACAYRTSILHFPPLEQLSQILKLSGATVVSGSAQNDVTVICDPHYWRESPDNSE